MDQSWVSAMGMAAEGAGLGFAALGLRRSKPNYNLVYSEPWWAPAGLAVAAAGLLLQLFDLTVL